MRSDAMIRWKLHQMMAEQRKRNKDLAQAINMSESRVSRLRKEDTMPAMKPETLNGICKFLGCQPGDLLIYEDDPEDNESFEINPNPTTLIEPELQEKLSKTKEDPKLNRSFLALVVEVLESA